MTGRSGPREPFLHQIIEARDFVPHALARAFRAGCDCTALGVGLAIDPAGRPHPEGRWTIEHEPRCPLALAGVAIDDLERHGRAEDDDTL